MGKGWLLSIDGLQTYADPRMKSPYHKPVTAVASIDIQWHAMKQGRKQVTSELVAVALRYKAAPLQCAREMNKT